MKIYGKVYIFMSDIQEKLRAFIIDNFLFGNADGLENNSSFLDEGIIDSTGVLELVDFLEEQFSVTVGDDELIPENLDSVDNIVAYLGRKSKTL